jgi:glycosyltransferase involved in cell wall biosynthesis
MQPISAVLITRNEADNLPATLEALQWCAEILIVDSGSTDATCDIAAAYGARVLHRPFQGFGPQKQFAVLQASNDWVLCLDADEVVTPALGQEIRQLTLQGDINGYLLPRQLVFLNKPFKYGRESREFHLRLFNRRFGNFNDAQVHEKAEVQGRIAKLSGGLLHYSYPDTEVYFRKFNEYTTRAAEGLAQRGKSRHPVLNLLTLPFNFLYRLIVYGNILNGYPGWIWSLYSAFYPVVKYAKVWEMRRKVDRA